MLALVVAEFLPDAVAWKMVSCRGRMRRRRRVMLAASAALSV
jgi:hypothetical protein